MALWRFRLHGKRKKRNRFYAMFFFSSAESPGQVSASLRDDSWLVSAACSLIPLSRGLSFFFSFSLVSLFRLDDCVPEPVLYLSGLELNLFWFGKLRQSRSSTKFLGSGSSSRRPWIPKAAKLHPRSVIAPLIHPLPQNTRRLCQLRIGILPFLLFHPLFFFFSFPLLVRPSDGHR